MATEDITTKFCSKCNATTVRYKNGKCKPCANISHAAYVARNKEKVAQYKNEWRLPQVDQLKAAARDRYKATAERRMRAVRAWAAANANKVKSYKKQWKVNNPEKLREYTFFRSTYRKTATPKWRDRTAMLALYREARRLSKDTGIEHHVDHIVPLKNALVCGLHYEKNMQILPAFDNLSKFNRHWPDMP